MKGGPSSKKAVSIVRNAPPEACNNRDHCVCGGTRSYDVANGTATASKNNQGYRGSQAIPLVQQTKHKICSVCTATMVQHKLHGEEAASFDARSVGGKLTRAQTSFAQFPCAYGDCALCVNAGLATERLMLEVSP